MSSESSTKNIVANPNDLRVRHRQHPARWAGAALVILLTAVVLHSMISNPRFQWDVVGDYLFSSAIISGVLNTLYLTVTAMIAGTVLGTVLAVLRLSPNPPLSVVTGAYVWFFRATPLLVQLLLWYNLGALYPEIALGIPSGPTFFNVPANEVISAWTAALLGLSLHQAAYTAEIVRAGLLSVENGQREAATALGMPPMLMLRRIVLPQAMRAIVPPMGNETISMMKTTSLVSIVALPELLNTAQTIYARTYQTIPLLIVATLWYLVLTAVLTVMQGFLERHFGRGASTQTSSLWKQLSRSKLGRPRTANAATPMDGQLDPTQTQLGAPK